MRAPNFEPTSFTPARRTPAPSAYAPSPYAPTAYTPWRDDASALAQSGPRFFGPAERPLFGWYHAPAGRVRGEAVVLCPSLGPEYMAGHRALRTLAERLAADGFAALRVDWPGTGDSAGDAADPACPTGAVAEWRSALGDAVARARAWSGAARVTVVGLRGGALVAADGFAFGAERVVLWWPPASGRQFLRELRMRHAMAEFDHDRYAPPDGDTALAAGCLESDGSVLAPGLVRDFGALTFGGASPASGEAFVLTPEQSAEGPAAAALAARGLRVESGRAPGHEAMRERALNVILPGQAIDHIARWLAERADAAPVSGVAAPPAAASAPGELAGVTAAALDGVREECVRFGADGRVAGVLTTPLAATPGAAGARPPVLLLHTGGNHRVGPSRMWPVWARRWAREGVTTLRFDPSGLGDTPALPGEEDAGPAPYADGHAAEVSAAAAYLCERTGAAGVVLVGLCSGGYYAVRAAGAGAPAVGVVAINPQLYAGHEALDRAAVQGHRAPAVLGAAARDPERWSRLLRGQTSARKVAMMVATGAGHAARAAVASAAHEVRAFTAVRARRRGAADGALEDLWRIRRAGVPLCFVFSHEDEGWAYLRVQARGAWRAFQRRHAVPVHVLENAEHTFVRAWMQRRLFALVSAALPGRAG